MAWWTRQMPGHMAIGWSSDQRSVASVHSAARLRSPSCSQALIRLQYTLPVVYGLSLPSTADSIASSRWPSPSVRLPASMRSRPMVWSAAASRSIDDSRRPRARASRASAVARSSSPDPVRDLGFSEHEVAERDRLRVGLQSTAGPPQPTTGDRRTSLELVVLPEPHRAPARAQAVALRLVQGVGLLASVDALIHLAEPPRRLRDDVETISLGSAGRDDCRPGRVERLGPSPRGQEAAGRLQCVSRGRGHLVSLVHRAARRGQPVSCLERCSSTGRISAVGLNSRNVTPSSVQPVCPAGQ